MASQARSFFSSFLPSSSLVPSVTPQTTDTPLQISFAGQKEERVARPSMSTCMSAVLTGQPSFPFRSTCTTLLLSWSNREFEWKENLVFVCLFFIKKEKRRESENMALAQMNVICYNHTIHHISGGKTARFAHANVLIWTAIILHIDSI